MAPSRRLPEPEAVLTGDGLWSTRYREPYRSTAGAAGEARHVFINGNDLESRFTACTGDFVVAELGFGSGLNFLLTWAAWRARARPGARLHYFAVENAPLALPDQQRFLSGRAPADLAERLLDGLPPLWPGWHDLQLAADVRLTLLYGEVAELEQADFAADAWYLDGFSPRVNPVMWAEETLREVKRLTRPGGTLATYSVATTFLRDLGATGFSIRRLAGYATKREMAMARRIGSAAPRPVPGRVGIVGAGIAGAALADAYRRQGVEPTVFAAADPVAASTNPAVVLSPRPTVRPTALGDLATFAFAHAERLARQHDNVLAEGALLLAHNEREDERQLQLSRQEWPADMMEVIDEDDAASIAGVDAELYGLSLPTAKLIDGNVMVARLLGEVQVVRAAVREVRQAGGCWHAMTADGQHEFDQLVLACGVGISDLLPEALITREHPGAYVKVGATAASRKLRVPLLYGGVLTTLLDGVAHLATDGAEMPEGLASIVGPASKRMWAATRCTTPDHLPYAGELGDNLLVLAGLGARGFTVGPYLAAAMVTRQAGAPTAVPRWLWDAVSPQRKVGAQPPSLSS